MSKIVQAVNTMIANPNLITNVTKSQNEVFFLFREKYKWSMAKRDDGLLLWFYPGDESLETLVSASASVWDQGIPMVTYRAAELGTREAKESFAELYTLVSEKVYGVDQALDDIISSADF